MTSDAQPMKTENRKYCCSNPNCREIFAKPKVIKYYMCPTCQTLIDKDEVDKDIETEVEFTNYLPTKLDSKITCEDEPKIPLAIEIATEVSLFKQEEKSVPEEKCSIVDKAKISEQLMPEKLTKVNIDNEIIPSHVKHSNEEETKTASLLSSSCTFGFGYLSQRQKGEGIPDTCIECPESLSCMLSKFYKKEENLKEIKKWYTF